MRTSHRLYDLSSAPAQINGFYVHFSWSVLINGDYPGQNQLIVNIRWGRGKGVVEKMRLEMALKQMLSIYEFFIRLELHGMDL